MTSRKRGEHALFWGTLASVVATDAVTKAAAVAVLVLPHHEVAVFGDWLRWRLVYNPGAAFGLHAGAYSRVIFTVLTVAALGILARVYTLTRSGDRPRLLAVGLITGGAIGNLMDRIRSSLGVVDFIDFGLGEVRWPTFNVADIAVSTGALLLAWVLWMEDEREPVRVVEAPVLESLTATADVESR